jgi:hypothetical protein
MSVRHPEPECSVFCSSSSQVSICQAYQAYQLMHNTQGAARPRRTPTARRSVASNLHLTARLRRVSSRFVESDESPFPTRTSSMSHANRESPDSGSRFVRLVECAAVSPGRSCGPVSPRSWLDVWVMLMLCHTPCILANPPTHTHQDPRTRCDGKWLLWTAYAFGLVI